VCSGLEYCKFPPLPQSARLTTPLSCIVASIARLVYTVILVEANVNADFASNFGGTLTPTPQTLCHNLLTTLLLHLRRRSKHDNVVRHRSLRLNSLRHPPLPRAPPQTPPRKIHPIKHALFALPLLARRGRLGLRYGVWSWCWE
jgi:hypothetical protein